jgi:hypothetical protein
VRGSAGLVVGHLHLDRAGVTIRVIAREVLVVAQVAAEVAPAARRQHVALATIVLAPTTVSASAGLMSVTAVVTHRR